MLKQIIIIIVLVILSIGSYILVLRDKSKTESIKIPEIVIPKKAITFKIIKGENNQINFRGIFSDRNISKEILGFLNGYKIVENITIDKSREIDRDIILFIKRVLKKLDSSFIEWTILYKDRKLLVSGKSTNIKSKNRIDNLIEISTLNCFSDIEIVKPKDNPFEIISNLKSVVENRDSKTSIKQKKIIKKNLVKRENIFSKEKRVAKDKREIEPAKIIPISYSEYKSLPDIQPIENIEEFEKKLKSKNKIIDKGTIYIDSPQ